MISPPSSMTMPYLVMWVIYDHPADYPHGYVLRPQFVSRDMIVPSNAAWFGATAEQVREHLPEGVTLIPRDDPNPVILEVWV